MTPIHHLMISHPFQGEGDLMQTQGEGAYQSVTCTKGRGNQVEGGPWWVTLSKKGWGGVWWVTQGGVGDRDESPNKGVGGTVTSHPKGACPKGGSTDHYQGGGVGADYVNVAPQSLLYYWTSELV